MQSLDDPDDVVELTANLVDGQSVALLVNAYKNSAGVCIEVKHQAQQLRDAGYDVTIVTFASDMAPPDGVELITIGQFENLYLEKLHLLAFPFRAFTLLDIADVLGKHDLVICHRYPLSAAAYAAKRKYGTPYVHWHYHIPEASEMPTLPRKVWVSLLGYLEERSFMIRNADVACSISESSREILFEESGIQSLVIANDAEVERFDGIESDDTYLYDEHDVSRDDSISVFVGRVSTTKNISSLVNMFNTVSRSVDDAKLVVVGKPTSDGYLQELQKEANQDVIFTGFVTDEELAGIYKNADLFVTASLKEGRNLPPLEAQEFGVPVLGFDVPGIRDVVSNGWLANRGSQSEYIDRWIAALSEEPS